MGIRIVVDPSINEGSDYLHRVKEQEDAEDHPGSTPHRINT